MNEWPLVTFTLLIQGSVGLVFMSAMYLGWLQHSLDGTQIRRMMLPVLIVSSAMGCLGLLASSSHMGYPLNAFHALRHFSSSWLSREIIFAAVYLAILCFYTFLVIIKKAKIQKMMLWLIALFGLIDVYCMSAIYAHSSMVTWEHFNTYFMFFGAVFIIGPVVALWLIALHVKRMIAGDTAIKLVITALAVTFLSLMIRLIEQPVFMAWLSETVAASDAVTFAHQPEVAYAQTYLLRLIAWISGLLGLFTLGFSLWQARKDILVRASGFVVLSTVFLLVSEICNRFAFFIVD